jgi:hypothetical protein
MFLEFKSMGSLTPSRTKKESTFRRRDDSRHSIVELSLKLSKDQISFCHMHSGRHGVGQEVEDGVTVEGAGVERGGKGPEDDEVTLLA